MEFVVYLFCLSVFYPKLSKIRRYFITSFNFAVECDIRKVQENQVVLKLNGTHDRYYTGKCRNINSC
jgi:hypothetical protein